MINNKNHDVSRQLDGSNNRRLHSKVRLANSYTAALRDEVETLPGSNVSIPSEESVLQAKDWVDNGSRT